MASIAVGCSTISFRHLGLDEALAEIGSLGFREIDLGILPGICDHYELRGGTPGSRRRVADLVQASGLTVRTVNLEPGHFTSPGASAPDIRSNFTEGALLAMELGAIGVSLSPGDPPPDGRESEYMSVEAAGLRDLAAIADEQGTKLLLEAPHFFRLLNCVSLSLGMYERIGRPDAVRLVLDTAHVRTGGENVTSAASLYGQRLAHVHIRDARPGAGFLPMGQGDINFPDLVMALTDSGYDGVLSLEMPLMTRSEGYFATHLTGAVPDSRMLLGEELTQAKRLELLDARMMLEGIIRPHPART